MGRNGAGIGCHNCHCMSWKDLMKSLFFLLWTVSFNHVDHKWYLKINILILMQFLWAHHHIHHTMNGVEPSCLRGGLDSEENQWMWEYSEGYNIYIAKDYRWHSQNTMFFQKTRCFYNTIVRTWCLQKESTNSKVPGSLGIYIYTHTHRCRFIPRSYPIRRQPLPKKLA